MIAGRWIRTHYPHMKSDEARIWTKFLETTALEFENIIYDLHLGMGILPVPGEPDFMKVLKLAVTRKRVDAIGETSDDIWIFEVKPRVGMSALGQLVTYFELYQEEYRPVKPVMLAAIGEREAPDIRSAFDLYAVNVILV
ncbi:hypothetical protein ES703_14222 [subsurface metagenome]